MDRRVFVKTPAEHRHGGRGICLSGKTALGTCTNTRKRQTGAKVSQGLSDEGRRGVKTQPSVIKPPPLYIHTHIHTIRKIKMGFSHAIRTTKKYDYSL